MPQMNAVVAVSPSEVNTEQLFPEGTNRIALMMQVAGGQMLATVVDDDGNLRCVLGMRHEVLELILAGSSESETIIIMRGPPPNEGGQDGGGVPKPGPRGIPIDNLRLVARDAAALHRRFHEINVGEIVSAAATGRGGR
jgi:hypothetical protein